MITNKFQIVKKNFDFFKKILMILRIFDLDHEIERVILYISIAVAEQISATYTMCGIFSQKFIQFSEIREILHLLENFFV